MGRRASTTRAEPAHDLGSRGSVLDGFPVETARPTSDGTTRRTNAWPAEAHAMTLRDASTDTSVPARINAVTKRLLLAANAAASLRGSVATEQEQLHAAMLSEALDDSLIELRMLSIELTVHADLEDLSRSPLPPGSVH